MRSFSTSFLMFLVLIAGCGLSGNGPTKQMIVYSKSASGKVTNGAAYDWISVRLDGIEKLQVPNDANVRLVRDSSSLEIYMKKKLSFWGHPAKSISIDNVRGGMGFACTRKGSVLTLATFGEWNCIEGGASIESLIFVPENTAIERVDSLEGMDSAGNGAKRKDILTADKIQFSAEVSGWLRMPDFPDSKMTVK